ncbi:BTAD domain-containing putative transcriptional regulator [Streptomyces sp. NPDC050997]|uniref:BTAD domain-containing putative transcriptional regulator n=1 Tax=Streptomyces sp. NPDC050997 TaxID=3155519 RepID=UPI003433A0FA
MSQNNVRTTHRKWHVPHSLERVAGRLTLALYRGGLIADALTHYQTAPGRLVEVLGTDPRPALHAGGLRRTRPRTRLAGR